MKRFRLAAGEESVYPDLMESPSELDDYCGSALSPRHSVLDQKNNCSPSFSAISSVRHKVAKANRPLPAAWGDQCLSLMQTY